MHVHYSIPFFLLAPLAAQTTVVSPPEWANVEAYSYSTVGIGGIGGTSAPAVLQSIREDLRGKTGTLRAVAFRRDGQNATGRTFPACNMIVRVFVSTAATTAASPDPTFANNHGSDKAAGLLVQPGVVPAGAAPRAGQSL